MRFTFYSFIFFSHFIDSGRLHAFQQGLTLKKSKEDMAFLMLLMDWLEKTKLELKTQEVFILYRLFSLPWVKLWCHVFYFCSFSMAADCVWWNCCPSSHWKCSNQTFPLGRFWRQGWTIQQVRLYIYAFIIFLIFYWCWLSIAVF